MRSTPAQDASQAPGAKELDVVIPVYNEGPNIVSTLDSLKAGLPVRANFLICYDSETDSTLPVLREYNPAPHEIVLVRNEGKGALGAVVTGFRRSTARSVLVFPADDDYNASNLPRIVELARQGNDVVAACRFMPGGTMVGCPWPKSMLVRAAALSLYYLARVPTRDPTNGLRLFSRRVLDNIPVESKAGFAYSLELLVKARRRGWPIAEAPAGWYERRTGQSRFKIFRWLPEYLRWYKYAFATSWLRRKEVA